MADRLVNAGLELIDEGLGSPDGLDPDIWSRRQNSTIPPLFASLTAAAVCRKAGTTYTQAVSARWGDIRLYVFDVMRRGLETAHSDGTTWAHLAERATAVFGEGIAAGRAPAEVCMPVVDDLLSFVLSSPRAILPVHLAPYLPHMGDTGRELSQQLRACHLQWGTALASAMDIAGYRFRPGWSAQLVVDCAQALLDGWIVRKWTVPELVPERPVGSPERSLYAEAVEAMGLGAIIPADRWA